MKMLLGRALCVALFTSIASTAAVAAGSERSSHSAIATGLSIPLPGDGAYLPGVPAQGRAVLVDAASQRLFMIENGRIVDSMLVVVGKPGTPTPSLASTIRYATVNPYWHVPTDLARTLIAPNVLEQGFSYLRTRGYQVVSDFVDDPEIIPPEEVDWEAVAAGRERIYVRQLPGPANSMGRIKFSLGHEQGVFLHDTPQRELFAEATRRFSAGCIRLQDAARLARWLLGNDPSVGSDAPEQHVQLPAPVPVVVTYLDEGAATDLASLR